MTDVVKMRMVIPSVRKQCKLLSTKFGYRLILMWPFGEINKLRSSSRETTSWLNIRWPSFAPKMACGNKNLGARDGLIILHSVWWRFHRQLERHKAADGHRARAAQWRGPYRHANQLPGQIETLILRSKQERPHWRTPKIGNVSIMD
jgi:hypothetical protein